MQLGHPNFLRLPKLLLLHVPPVILEHVLSLLGSLKKTDPQARIDDLTLLRKTGGKSGDWGRLVENPS